MSTTSNTNRKLATDTARAAGLARGKEVGRLPVFVSPDELVFVSEDESTHSQVLVLYNPSKFYITFRILCSSPNKYSVVEPHGTINPQCCVDIVVKHNLARQGPFGSVDRFRVDYCHKKLVGQKMIASKLNKTQKPTVQDQDQDSEGFFATPQNTSTSTSASTCTVEPETSVTTKDRRARTKNTSPTPTSNSQLYLLTWFVALVCVCVLLLPEAESQRYASSVDCTEDTERMTDDSATAKETDNPFLLYLNYLYVTTSQKVLASFVLGLITMAVFG